MLGFERRIERAEAARGIGEFANACLPSYDFTEYADDPVGFGEKVLKEKYTDDIKRVMESVRDFEVTVVRSCNAPGKTHVAASIAIWWYKSHINSQVYTGAAPPESNLRKLLWGEIGSRVEKYPWLFTDDRVTGLHISRGAQEFLTGVTIPSSGSPAQREAKFSGKHAPYLLFIIDEGDAVPDEVYKGIESCMSGGHVRLLILFNPRKEEGAPYRLERDGRANIVELSAFRHPNVVEGKNIFPGAVTREATVRRINEWARPVVEGEEVQECDCFELPDFLEGTTAKDQKGELYPPLVAGRYKITVPAFAYMVLGRYPSQAQGQLISREWTSAARMRWDAWVRQHGEVPNPGAVCIHGQDVSEQGEDSSCAIFRWGGYVERPVTWGGVDVLKTGDRALKEAKDRGVFRTYVDSNGVGSGVPPHMARSGYNRAVPVKTQEKATDKCDLGTFGILRDQLWWAMREWLRDPLNGAMLPPDEELIEDLLCPTYEVLNGKIHIMKKKDMREILQRSPDRGDALALTFMKNTGAFEDCDLS